MALDLEMEKDEPGDDDQDKLDAAAELRDALSGDDDQAVVDAFDALYQLTRKS